MQHIFIKFHQTTELTWEVAAKFVLENTIKNTQSISDGICLLFYQIFNLWFSSPTLGVLLNAFG